MCLSMALQRFFLFFPSVSLSQFASQLILSYLLLLLLLLLLLIFVNVTLLCNRQFTHWNVTFWQNLKKIVAVILQDLTSHWSNTAASHARQ